MKHFCTICGSPTSYSLALPKFCSQCGNEFSLVTKQKDKSVHDQALEKAKEKYSLNTPSFVPQPEPKIKTYPNPARASFAYKLVDENSETEGQNEDINDEMYDDTVENTLNDDNIQISANIFKNIRPKFKLQETRTSSQSFENLITQGYVNNYKPVDTSEIRELSASLPEPNRSSVLDEFKKEAGSLRAKQD